MTLACASPGARTSPRTVFPVRSWPSQTKVKSWASFLAPTVAVAVAILCPLIDAPGQVRDARSVEASEGFWRAGVDAIAPRTWREVRSWKTPGVCLRTAAGPCSNKYAAGYGVAGENADRLDDAFLRLKDLDRVARDLDARAGLWDVLQVLEQQAVDGLGAVQGEIEAELAVEFPQGGVAFDQNAAVLLDFEGTAVQGRLGGELADDFLENVLDRDEPHELSVLIDDEADASLGFPGNAGADSKAAFRKGCNSASRSTFSQALPREVAVLDEVHQFAHMDDADDLVEVTLVGRQPRVIAGSDLALRILDRAVDVDRLDPLARRHHVVHGNVFEVEQVHAGCCGASAERSCPIPARASGVLPG